MRPDGDPGAVRSDRLRTLLLALLSFAFLLHVAVATRTAFLDDAFITFRYARNLADGAGLVFNAGERVEGYTNFSWVLLSAAIYAVGLSPPVWAPVLGAACGAAGILVVARGARVVGEAEGRRHRFSGIPAAAVLAASTSLAFWSGTGLETPLFVLLMTAAGLSLVEGNGRRFAVLTGLAFFTRPEAALLGFLGAAWFVSTDKRRFEVPLLLAVIVAPFLAFKLWYFGALLPNTRLAKPAVLSEGAEYVGWALVDLAGLLVLGVGAAFVSRRSRALVGLFAVHALAVALEGGDWMPFTRLLLPALGWLAVACDGPFLDWARIPKDRRSVGRALLALSSLLYVPQSLLDLGWVRERGTVERDAAYYRWLAAMGGDGARSVATFDIGLVGWTHPEWRIIDLAGLTDREIASLEGGHYGKRPTPELLEKKAPDALLVTVKSATPLVCHYAVECNVAGLPWFRERFVRKGTFVIAGNYALVWYERKRRAR